MQDDFSHSTEKSVLVIGAAGVDLIGRVKGNLTAGTSNPAHIRSSYGGAARNIAENLVRLGQPVQLITAIGHDPAGEEMLAQLAGLGVDTSHVHHSEVHPTGTYLAVLKEGGELLYALDDMRAVNELTPAYFNERAEIFRDSSAVFVDGNLPRESLRRIVLLTKRAEVPLCVNPTSTSLAMKFKPFLKNISLLTSNIKEAMVLSGRKEEIRLREDAIQTAKSLVADGARIVVVTMAEAGMCYATSETSGQIPAIRSKIVDPTGVGDAIAAAIVFALLNNIPIDDAVQLGVSAASLTLSHNGAVYPNLSLEHLYDNLAG